MKHTQENNNNTAEQKERKKKKKEKQKWWLKYDWIKERRTQTYKNYSK